LKYFILSIIFLSLLSCNKEEGVWDKLTTAERLALRNRAETKCRSDSKNHFDSFKKNSDSLFYGTETADYVKGTTFNHSFDNDDYTHKITIWKKTATDVYFLIFVDDSTDIYRFLKIPKTTNDSMIEDLQNKYCNKTTTSDPYFSLSTSSKTYKQFKTVSSTKETTYTFSYSLNLLAFFSSYKESRKDQTLDTNGDATGEAKTLVGTLSAAVGPVENVPEFDTYADYLANYPTTTLCIVNYSAIPYDITCDATGTTTFPATELKIIHLESF
jgi:hypothetical protein